jgi:ribosomal protein S5
VLHSAASGTGVIAGDVDDVTPYSAGSVILMSNSAGLTNESDLVITATTETDITVTVIGATA